MCSLDAYDATTLYDATALATAISRFIRARRVVPSVDRDTMIRRIRKYIQACRQWGTDNVAIYRDSYAGWTERDEELWRGWVYDRFLPWEWDTEVLQPVFGNDRRAWEPDRTSSTSDGWRYGLFEIVIHQWLKRSLSIVERYDPEPRMNEDEKRQMENDADEQWSD